MYFLYLLNSCFFLYIVYRATNNFHEKKLLTNDNSNMRSIIFINIDFKKNSNEYFEKIKNSNYTFINVFNNYPIKYKSNDIDTKNYILNLRRIIVRNINILNSDDKLIIISNNNIIKNHILFYDFINTNKILIFSLEDFAKFLIHPSKIINYDVNSLSVFFKINEKNNKNNTDDKEIKSTNEYKCANEDKSTNEDNSTNKDKSDNEDESNNESNIDKQIKDFELNGNKDISLLIYKKLCDLLVHRVIIPNNIVYDDLNLSNLNIKIDKNIRCRYTKNIYETIYDNYIYNKLLNENDSSSNDGSSNDEDSSKISDDNLFEFEEITTGTSENENENENEDDNPSNIIMNNSLNILKKSIAHMFYSNPQYVYEYLKYKGEISLVP